MQLRISTSEGGLRKGSNKQQVAAILASKPKGNSVLDAELAGSNQTSISWTSLLTFLLFLIVPRDAKSSSKYSTQLRLDKQESYATTIGSLPAELTVEA